MYINNFVHHLTKILVDIMLYTGAACCVALPFAMPTLMSFFGYTKIGVVPITTVLLSTGLCMLYILWNLKLMLRTLMSGNPFIEKNVTCLKKCAVSSLLIALIYAVKIIFWLTIVSSVISIIFLLLGLFCLTLEDVFKQAVAYKQENDWTV